MKPALMIAMALVISACASRAGSARDVSKKTVEKTADTKIADSGTVE